MFITSRTGYCVEALFILLPTLCGMAREPDLPDQSAWPIEESRVEYETGWYTGGYDIVEQPDGTSKRYY